MYPSIGTPSFLGSVLHLSRNTGSRDSGLTIPSFDDGDISSHKYAFRNTTKRMKKLPLSLPLEQSKYKWENANNRTRSPKSTFCNGTPSLWNENVVASHYRPSVPFITTIVKGWFTEKSCDVSCTKSSTFDLQSCCFIDDKYVPENTISANMLSLKPTNMVQKKFKSLNFRNEDSLVKLSKHKLIRKQDRSSNPKVISRRSDSSLILRTRRKLIRKTESISNQSSNCSPVSHIPLTPVVKFSDENTPNTVTGTPEEETSSKKSDPTSLIVLTRRKLVRESQAPGVPVPNKLISVSRNNLVNSCLLKNNTKLSKSVLYHMIKQRRRPYSRSSYVLLTRNKLIRRAMFKQKLWRKQSLDGLKGPKRTHTPSKTFVSVGQNKLIRKSLFSKCNKNVASKTAEKTSPTFRKAILARVLNSPSKRIQRFTNHLSRINLKYSFIRGRSRYANKSKKYLNKCKNNRRTFRRKNIKICPIYRRKGTCLKYTKKNCPFLHDTKYIVLCPKYLKDVCEEENCLLSHDLIPQKMSICVPFLNDICTIDGCHFLHSKPDVNAPICVQFLRGYCELADKCPNWHVYACPDYKKSSTCARENCRLPHRSIENFENDLMDEKNADIDAWRYFEKSALNDEDLRSLSVIPKRVAMGNLPDFIPL